ncbi:pyridoxal phosphate-dependent aminotransferase [Silvibacterium dinghuense]|uniref:Aminotransferase n=1 Tax=Silvibacterium dinghuense TaxID=1560006 RepID=A0A4Q1S8P1_9BACT|nr:aminotransferase class I/II-fold pyridoxal phosphate-dependent enzyme [Silvibacterium dinghuense]RXS93301.1 aminotransferase class I/II-fold pyridoxal phosphate-dependent enzyme [Silvibacterium dinghuense]GGH04714.1 aminotransferase [Silvibacterium dinghuense]
MATATTKLHLSQIAPHVVQSEIRSMSVECDRLGGVNLAQGICDTEVPSPVVARAIEAIHDGYNIYTRLDGVAPLRQAIARKLARDNGMQVDPEAEVLVTSGATGGLYAAALALLDPGDEVILFEPFYGYHLNTLLSLRIKPVAVPLAMHTWELDLDRLRASITPKTRAILVNTPSNPCGKVFSRKELEAIAELAIEHDLFVFTDEIYEYFVFDGTEHISPATLPGMRERTITISGLSKTFSITGWRIGYLAADKRWTGAIGYFHDLTYVCAPSPFQYGAAAGLMELPRTFYESLSSEYQLKRDQLCAALTDVGLTPAVPAGAYYVLADVSRLPGETAREKARNLLRETKVAAVAGTAFFTEGRGENLLRFCFAKREHDLERACELIRSLK